jgi:hypothetical protein
MLWVKTDFDKNYLEGSRELFDKIKQAGHDVTLNHKFGDEFLIYGSRDAYDKRNKKANPDDRYKRQSA